MHGGADLGHCGNDYALCRLFLEECRRQLADSLTRGTLAHTNENDLVANRHYVAALQSGQPMILCGIAPPNVDLACEIGMELVDRGGENCLLVSCRPIECVQCHSAVDPARGIARIECI